MVKNPLRLLDCKQPQCQPIIDEAPPISGMLCMECAEHFRSLRAYLDDLNRPYTVNHRLVRGLDYYTKTVFEVWAEGIGAQNAICGGGRYDGLAEVLGGPFTPAVGFASGLERIVLTMQNEQDTVDTCLDPRFFLAVQGDAAKRVGMSLLAEMRAHDIPSMMGFGDRSLKAQLREANKRKVRYAIVLGDDEIASGEYTMKNMESGEQRSIPKDEIIPFAREETRNE
jgi:histidyl-tRNA synthetase